MFFNFISKLNFNSVIDSQIDSQIDSHILVFIKKVIESIESSEYSDNELSI